MKGMTGVWLIEYRLFPEGGWFPNPSRGCFELLEAAKAACVEAHEKYPSTDYRPRLYAPAEAQP